MLISITRNGLEKLWLAGCCTQFLVNPSRLLLQGQRLTLGGYALKMLVACFDDPLGS